MRAPTNNAERLRWCLIIIAGAVTLALVLLSRPGVLGFVLAGG